MERRSGDQHGMSVFGGILTGWVRRLSGLRADTKGGVLIYTALLMPVLMGFAGLSVDVAIWYAKKHSVQNAVDSAAVAAALEVGRTGLPANIQAVALENAMLGGFDAAGGDILTVNWPPAHGPAAGNANFVEATIASPARSWFSSIFLADNFNIAARAVATTNITANGCVWALNPDLRAALKIAGNADLNLDCAIYVNSRDPEAIEQIGSSCVNATGISVVGGASGRCLNPAATEGVIRYRDPLADIEPPAHGGCTTSRNINVRNGETLDFSPGVYCGTINISGGANFLPGTYVLDGTGMTFNGQSTVTGDDVFFYLTDAGGVPDNIVINGGADVTLNASETGDYQGILIYHDRGSDPNITHSFTGGAGMHLNGVIYTPNNDLIFAGNSNFGGRMMLVADTIEFTGGANFFGLDGSILEQYANGGGAVLVE